jgi:hypothetical protein
MSFFKNLLGIDPKPRTMLNDVQEVTGRLIVKGYRKIAAQHGCAPTAKTTDAEIMVIYKTVTTLFHRAAQQRGERIPALFDNRIVLKFLHVHEMMPNHFEKHLEYEVEKYLAEGLRPDYKLELQLFDPHGNDPDVKRLRELQKETREKIEQDTAQKQISPFPYFKIATMILQSGVATSAESVTTAEKIACKKFSDATHLSLLKEIIAYHSKIAIASLMAKGRLAGKENYKQIEAGLFDALREGLGKNLSNYLPLVDEESRQITEMYFVRNHDALAISREQIYDFAKRYDREQILAELPADQMSVFYYTIRAARILKVHNDIDKAIVFYVSGLLVKRAMEQQNEINAL